MSAGLASVNSELPADVWAGKYWGKTLSVLDSQFRDLCRIGIAHLAVDRAAIAIVLRQASLNARQTRDAELDACAIRQCAFFRADEERNTRSHVWNVCYRQRGDSTNKGWLYWTAKTRPDWPSRGRPATHWIVVTIYQNMKRRRENEKTKRA